MSRTSPTKKPPSLPRHITFSVELSQALAGVEPTPDETFNLTSAGVELQQASAAAVEAELVALQRRIGIWKPSSSEFDEVQHSPGDIAGSSASAAAEASDPVAIGFELRPLETMGISLRPGAIGDHHAAACREASSPTEGGREASGKVESPISKSRPAPAKTQTPQHQTTAGNWQRRPRNREGCSEEVRSRERRRLERVVKSCGLVLEPDPEAPNREVLRAAPAPRLKRSSQEQSEATQRLVRGLSTRSLGTQRPQSACGGSAARLLRAERQRLAGHPDPQVKPSTHKRPLSAGSRACGQRGTPTQTSTSAPSVQSDAPVYVHGLPLGETAAVLQSALAGMVPVHMTQGPSMSSTASTSKVQEGSTPPASLRADVLAAALRGEIPVRSITTAVTKAWSADCAKALAPTTQIGGKDILAAPKDVLLDRILGSACVGGVRTNGQLPGVGAFVERHIARESELEEPDQELAPRCEANASPRHST